MSVMFHPVNILGVPRSGKTTVAKLLAYGKFYHKVPEFMNPKGGIYNQNKPFNWYEVVDEKYDKQVVENFINPIFTFKYKDERRLNVLRKHIDHYSRCLLSLNQKVFGYPQAVLDDPFMVFSTKFFNCKYKTSNVVIIRHPASVYLEFKRKHWDINLNNWADNKKIIAQLSNSQRSLIDEYKDGHKLIYKVSVMWSVVYNYLISVTANNGIVIQFEQLMLDPEKTFSELCKYLNLSFSTKTLKRILNKRQFHYINCYSADKLKNATKKNNLQEWKSQITEEELEIIKAIANPLMKNTFVSKTGL